MTTTFLISSLIVLFLILIYYYYIKTDLVVGDDGYRYYMYTSFQNYNEATELLSKINKDLIKFFSVLRIKYRVDDTSVPMLIKQQEESDSIDDYGNLTESAYRKAVVEHILHNYDPDSLFETNPLITTDTSFTLNKGTSMNICLRDKKNPDKFVDYGALMFVVLHELSHIGAYDVRDHTEKFWQVFKFVLIEAVDAGIYTPVDYSKNKVDYCGLNITYSPLFDPHLQSI
jgi:hypothetical protein